MCFNLRTENFLKDESFLLQLFIEARAHIFGPMPLAPSQKEMLIHQQFHTQRFSYQAMFTEPAPKFQILESDGKPIGRLYTHETSDRVHIIDIAISEGERGKGVGSRVLCRLLKKAQKQKKMVSLTVEKGRPAIRLYKRLGFDVASEENGLLQMQVRLSRDE
ncbi:GNAT family N-acetyltransferase [Kordiimonas laminariae]|uniref:GNAT family N-acetyltransferase n=1 Tax=Kordiimonas laminariae TaxID=2917717 RepID=UPI001FF6C784|nr:GNAT family N-acetyltransferase [Kordiimonas laminariae]MCK0071161.1 GNAT family N-acetyltransferase [Kordiimonas laminariae]